MKIKSIWEEFLIIIKEEAGSRVVDTWFKAVTLSHWDSILHVASLEAPNQFVLDWIKNNYSSLIQTHLSRLLHVDKIKLLFILHGEQKQQSNDSHKREQNHLPPIVSTPAIAESNIVYNSKQSQQNQISVARARGTLNLNQTFSTFVVGPSNSLAYAAAQAVAEKPGNLYNPLFFYGGSGLGKTHLLHAIGNEIKVSYPKAVILYQTADRFVNEFINAIRFDKVHKFQEKYKSVDVLLIDDIQFISNKEQTQEAFFHIFNSLYDLKKQIIFSSDTVPQNIRGLAERLRSRLAWGLVADIRSPALETKIAILKKKAELSNELLPDDVAHFIASRVVSNIRELEGSLIRVMAFASLTGQQVSLELAQKVLVRQGEVRSEPVDFEKIIKCLSNYYPYKLEQLRSKDRSKDLACVRQIAMFLMKKMTDKSLRDIGIFLGGRDHSTVMHALAKVQEQCELDDSFKVNLQRLEEDILRIRRN